MPACASTVLELGAGVGVASLCLARRLAHTQVYALELQPDYAALAQRNAQENGLPITVYQGDLVQMPAPLRQMRFDHVIANPPYGGRIGNKKLLYALYGSFGTVMKERFSGWRVGIITNEGGLAHATGLPLKSGPPVDHGGLKVKLYQTAPLP